MTSPGPSFANVGGTQCQHLPPYQTTATSSSKHVIGRSPRWLHRLWGELYYHLVQEHIPEDPCYRIGSSCYRQASMHDRTWATIELRDDSGLVSSTEYGVIDRPQSSCSGGQSFRWGEMHTEAPRILSVGPEYLDATDRQYGN